MKMKLKTLSFVGAAALASVLGATAPQAAEASFFTSGSTYILTGSMGCTRGFGTIVLYQPEFGGPSGQYRVHTVVNGVFYPTAWMTAGPAGQTNFAVGRSPAVGVTYAIYFEYREWDPIMRRWSPARGEYVVKTVNGVNTYYCRG